jgi:hypothetical protein
MTNRMLLVVCAMMLARPVAACSLAPGYEAFQVRPAPEKSALIHPPSVSVENIRRGHRGDSGLCADLGFLVLKVLNARLGYRFEIVEGKLDGVFPEGFIQPAAPGYLSFVWVDGNTDAQEPIQIVVKVTAMSKAGHLSEPLMLRIADPGRAAARQH